MTGVQSGLIASGDMHDDTLAIAEAWLAGGRRIVLATVVETWGSAPRPIGSHLVIDADGNFEGSVSGGCVEGEVIVAAVDLAGSQGIDTLDFGVADETAWRAGLSCGGRIRIHLQALQPEDAVGLSRLDRARQERQAAIHAISLSGNRGLFFFEGEEVDPAFDAPVSAGFQSGRSGVTAVDGEMWLFNAHIPPARIVIVGAVHIAQVLAPMATMTGFSVRVIDPRAAYATPERFAGCDLAVEWPADALRGRPLDSRTALVAVSHDPGIDDLPLGEALTAGCFYVGALGSRKTHAKRLERLAAAGLSTDDLARIHAPIGLDIGAAGPAEIAVAILGDIIRALRKPEIAAAQALPTPCLS